MENHQKQRKMKKKWSCKCKKNENLDSKLQILTPNQEIFKNSRKFSCFYHFFIFLSFSLPVAPEIQESHEKQWKTMENHQKQRKMKKNEVANEKKHENLDSKLQILTPNQEIFKNSRKIFISFHFLSCFFLIVFIIFFSFSLPVAPEIQESHEKTMKNNGKPSKTKENEKNMKLQMKKTWKFGLKVADSHSEPGNLQKRGNFHFFMFLSFFHFFIMFFSFSLPVAPEIQESHEKQWKTMENHQKQRKMKKTWSCKWKKWSCKWKNEVANEKWR